MRRFWSSLCLVALPATLYGQVTYERLLRPEREPANWLTYSGNYQSYRYSALDQITIDNVSALKPVWLYQHTQGGSIETSPLVVDGIMYLTLPLGGW